MSLAESLSAWWNLATESPDLQEFKGMSQEILIERFFGTLINGDRPAARTMVQETLNQGVAPPQIVSDLYWPTYEMVEKLYRNDQLSRLSHRFATRLLRVLVDQTAALFPRAEIPRRSVFAVCGPTDADELGAQMAVDLLECAGFDVRFSGGGIPNDEIMGHIHECRPDILLLFATGAQDLPELRALIDTLYEIDACPVQICVGGGVFNRAEGLAEEIGADLWATDPLELVDRMIHEPDRRATAEQRTVGRRRIRKAA